MGGIIIFNMQAPQNCFTCSVERQANCDIYQGVESASNYKDKRYEKCPLINIIQCNECKWAEKEGDESEGYLTCACHIPRFFVPEDGFCFLGERRE